MRDPRIALVRDGYDAIGESYLADRPLAAQDVDLLRELVARLAPASSVLDAGCGAGVPVTKWLINAGFAVSGLDMSRNQLGLAQSLVPAARLTQANLVELPFRDRSFQAVVSYYAVIHVPRELHQRVLGEFHRVTQRDGVALLCLGANDIPADHDPQSWLGVPMFWSHFDASTNLEMVQHAGFNVLWHRMVKDPMDHAEHLFVLASRS